jgi:hypothetical protein
MSDTPDRALIWGFGDVAAGVGGLAWDLGEPGALLLSKGAVRPATFSIEEGGDATVLELAGEEDTLEATLSPQMGLVQQADVGNPVGFRALACLAEVRSKGGSQTFQCSGQITRWEGRFLKGAGTLRHLAIQDGDAQVIATSQGEPGAAHGDERSSGWLIGGEHGVSFEETLISTQYNDGGAPTRIGLELWPEDADHASRAGAVRVAGSVLGGIDAGGTWAGLFRCHTDGAEGLGSYLLWRA